MKESNDILTLFESLNNHEVFTPPRLARELLSLIPKSVWSDPNTRVLDPCVKSGVFLREAMYLCFEGLRGKGSFKAQDGNTYNLEEPKQLMKHILKNMLFGISTSELTGYLSRRTLYGVMEANTDKQTALIDAFGRSKNNHEWTEDEKVNFLIRNWFNDYYDHKMFNVLDYKGYEREGNIFYPREKVQKKVIEDGSYEIEDTYYPFIEDNTEHSKIEQIRNGEMKFDVIIGNPPYQISDGGNAASAKPIYHKFVESAFSLSPKYISFIIPARWYAGGKGLKNFRESMLLNTHVSHLIDYANGKDCFPGTSIGGGVCYFLYNKSYTGPCQVTNINNGSSSVSKRSLSRYPFFIRDNKSVKIIESMGDKLKNSIASIISSRNPFGYPTKHRGKETSFPSCLTLHSSQGISYVPREAESKYDTAIDSYNVIISRVTTEHANEPAKDGRFKVLSTIKVIGPKEVCTDSYLRLGAFETSEEAENLAAYLKTKTARFLLLQAITSINLSSEKFIFVPLVDFSECWTDSKLKVHFSLSDEQVLYINASMREID
ncbi:MAG: Eco57I restriction-modification methylase domain-containing protein [Pseudomonadales bacterium]|nr:Eco57I restriction-modification methylase domain-containing protein [Pseudomonadales bacterium]